MSRILYNFASRSRKQKFFACVENIYINSHNKDFTILASLDIDDPIMNTPDTIKSMKRYDKLYPVWGASKNKIDAINRSMVAAPEWDLLFNISDDMMFIQCGYDEIVENDIKEHFPGGDCLLHYPDQHQGKNCMTMSIMDKKYYDRFGFIYYPGYESLWCDVDAQETGKMLGRYKFINKRIFNHYHPSFGDTGYDAQYRKTEDMEVRNRDQDTFNGRLNRNFDLSL
jgi:hypothetical protein